MGISSQETSFLLLSTSGDSSQHLLLLSTHPFRFDLLCRLKSSSIPSSRHLSHHEHHHSSDYASLEIIPTMPRLMIHGEIYYVIRSSIISYSVDISRIPIEITRNDFIIINCLFLFDALTHFIKVSIYPLILENDLFYSPHDMIHANIVYTKEPTSGENDRGKRALAPGRARLKEVLLNIPVVIKNDQSGNYERNGD